MNRICGKCKVGTEFHKGAWFCKACTCAASRANHAKRVADPISKRKYSSRYYKSKYGLTAEEYDTRYKNQKVCAICSTELLGGLQTHLDHDHNSGKLREFLCTNCNRGLGHFQENKQNLLNALKYLDKHSGQLNE